MANGSLTAAWIQSGPVYVAALIAAFGLSNWPRQHRAQKRIEHAEAALIAGHQAISAIRSARSPGISYPQEEAASFAGQGEAFQNHILSRLENCRQAQIAFAGQYLRIRLYTKPGAGFKRIDNELADIIYDLYIEANTMLSARQMLSTSDDSIEKYRSASESFFFIPARITGKVDPFERRIESAERSLHKQLLPLLRPQLIGATPDTIA